jgi:hypothetical protein
VGSGEYFRAFLNQGLLPASQKAVKRKQELQEAWGKISLRVEAGGHGIESASGCRHLYFAC